MHANRGPLFLGLVALGGVAGAHVAGCGGGSNTAHATGTTGSGASTTSTSTTSTGITGTSTSSTSTSGGGSGNGGGGAGGSSCGDGKIEGMEQCDLGTANGSGMGCDSSCAFDCMADADCNKMANPCIGTATCVSATVQGQMVKQCMAGTPLAQGASCGTNLFCVSMNCVAPSCGDGVVEAPEECDNGGANGPGTGCESTCKFSCLATDPTRNCSSTNACVQNGTCGATHTCTAGANVANGTACTGGTCQNGTCVVASCTGQPKCSACAAGLCSGSPQGCNASTCGDGCVDAAKGETCEPPNTATCDAQCHTIMATAVCGNGKIEGNEQCDDGNTFDLDGCDSKCNYEVVTRMSAIAIAGTAAPAALGCMPSTNQLGAKAITNLALGQLNGTLTTDVNNGTVNVTTQFLGLTDLTGVASAPFQIGVGDAVPDPAKGTPMNNPIDWWFFADHSTISMGLPTGLLSAALANRNLTGGPSNVTLTLNLGGSPALLTMNAAHIAGTINGNPAPNVPAPPPAALKAGLTVFQTITASGAGQGLCGNITVASLAAIPLPAALAAGGSTACGQGYTACVAPNTPGNSNCNSLLDALVGGCTILGFLTAINPTQPDVPAGSKLTVGANKKVTVTAANGTDAYSAYLTFNANRVHFTGENCAVTADCQTGKTCTAGVCK